MIGRTGRAATTGRVPDRRVSVARWHDDHVATRTSVDKRRILVSSEHDDPGRREPARYDDPDEAAMRRAIERFRRATEQAGAGCDAAVAAHADACTARAAWLPRLADRIADAERIRDEQRDAFTLLAGQDDRNLAIVEAGEALDHAERRADTLRRLRDDAARAEATRASMIETARRVAETARGRDWHQGDSGELAPPDDWRDVG
jgi:hypothetical protein